MMIEALQSPVLTENKIGFRVEEIPAEFLNQVRTAGLDAQGQVVRRIRSEEGGEPCRDVLRRARPGEELILASFCPFSLSGPYKEYGPIFVLAQPSEEKVEREVLPLVGMEQEPYLRELFVLRAYNDVEEIIDGMLVKSSEAAQILNQFLSRPEVAFVHARFPVYGCFGCRINRSAGV
jgi:hypothetical protein